MDQVPVEPLRGGRRRLQLRLPLTLLGAVEACARRSEVPTGAFVRLLLEDVMADRPATLGQALRARRPSDPELPAIAGLVASEHVRHILETVFSSHRVELAQARVLAYASAEERLEELRLRLEREAAS